MKNANKRIIVYLVIVVSLLIFLIIETMVLKSRLDRKLQESGKQNSETMETDPANVINGENGSAQALENESSGVTTANGQAPENGQAHENDHNPGSAQTAISDADAKLQMIWRKAADIYGKNPDPDTAFQEMNDLIDEGILFPGSDNSFSKDDIKKLYDYWDETNAKGFVNQDSLPEGLPEDDSLCIVILGYALKPDGSMRDELKLRLDEGLENSKKYPNAYVLVTGGGTALMNPNIKEADKMAEYLKEKGLDPSRIIIENDSMTTAENAVFCESILRTSYPRVKELAIISSDYHIPLGCQIFQGWFIMNGSELKVTSNSACHPGNPTVFAIRDQVFWMEELTGYLMSP